MFAQIILAKVNAYTDRLYTYAVPAEISSKAKVGMQVLVEFGKKKAVGYIVKLSDIVDENIGKIKPVIEIRGEVPFFSSENVEIADWMASYYCASFSACLRLMFPPGSQAYERPGGKKRFAPPDRTSNKTSVLGVRAGVTLLFGSSRTQYYLKTLEQTIASGKGAIVLLPEITAGNLVISEISRTFGSKVAILHSSMTEKERAKEWERIYSGEARLVIGTRSALFAPIKDLGLMIIDSEEEFTYKSEQGPRYHAREVAAYICKEKNIPLILGSGCPSVETFYNAKNGKYSLVELGPGSSSAQDIEIIDMKTAGKMGESLSKRLIDEIGSAIRSGQRSAVIINKRGYSSFIICADCGNVLECPSCALSLSYHTTDKKLHCIKCGYEQSARSVCPKCLSSMLKFIGTGSQKIESDMAKLFPDVKIFRVDSDMAKTKGSFNKVLEGFEKETDSMIIGTQMIDKALERTQAGLAAIISADGPLFSPDFRSAEGTFKMISDICGFSKNIKKPGKVLIQTFNPGHYAITRAMNNDYAGFYDMEIPQRKDASYPPFGSLINIFLYGADNICVRNVAESICNGLNPLPEGVLVLGPQQAGISKIRGAVKWQMLIKGKNLDIIKQKLKAVSDAAVLAGQKRFGRRIRISIDVDPITII